MDDVEIAVATTEDIDGVHRLEVEAFPSPWRREFFVSELTASGRLNLVARRQGKVIAYVFAMWFFDEMHVNKIAVTRSERRQGIAAELMDRCVAFAKAHRIKSVSLEVRKSNQGAQEFYKRLDFQATYVRQRYYPDGEAAVVMTKSLTL
jgi:ribosomal-protein-alanine N-acetyltransferase